MRKLWIVLGIAAALVGVALAVLFFAIDTDSFGNLIETRAEAALGREVGLGELGLSFWPFGVHVDALTVGGRPGEGSAQLLVADGVTVGARLLPLLSKRLEVTTITVEAPRLEVVRGADGSWNLEHLLDERTVEGAPAAQDGGGEKLLVRALRVTDGTVLIRDPGDGTKPPLEWTLEDVTLDVDELASDQPIDFELSARVAGQETRFSLNGRGGPLSKLSSGAPLEVDLEVTQLSLVELSKLVASEAVQVASGVVTLRAEVRGTMPDSLDVRGRLEVEDGAVAVPQADGGSRNVDVGLEADFAVGVRERGSLIELDEVVAKLDGHALPLRGTIRPLDEVPSVDLEIAAASLPAETVLKLMSLAGIPSPVAFSSDVPIELDATVRGPVGSGTAPEIRARARLRGFTLAHPSLKEPVKNAGASVSLAGQRLEVSELTASIGSSDVAGRVTIEGLASPRAQFELRSKQADFDELFSFLVEEEGSSSARSGGGSADPAGGLEMRGSLAIERGRFASLAFSNLDAIVSFANGTLALDPLSARLYEGTFRGAITSRLMDDPPPFTVDGTTEAIDVGLFLGENLGLPNLLDGRLAGRIVTRGAGTEIEQVLPLLEGSGSIDVRDGRVGQLNLLDRLAGVSGLLGESTLQKLSGKLAADGTSFEELSSKVRLERGRLFLDGLALEAADFRLVGDSAIDLIAGNIDGSFRLAFSPAVSAALEAEDSLASKLFWSSTTKRVELPFTLSGPWSAPKPGVDLEGVARDRVREELRDRLAEELGARLGGKREEGDAGATEPVTGAGPAPAAPPIVQTHESLAVEFTGTRWRGPILARDLEVSGTASGIDLARVSLVVSDAEGRVIDNVEQLDDVHRWVEATTDRSGRASVPWKFKIDGERLVLGRSPFAVTVSAFNGAGESAIATLPVER